jgi:hypothetical protein
MAVLRPDEEVSRVNQEKSQRLMRGVKGAALGAAGASIAPFLSEYVPSELALKGISKIMPKVGNFLKKGMAAGLDLKEGIEFLKGKKPEESNQQESAKEGRNIIQQYSPELFQFIDQSIRKGENPLEAGTKAINDKRFSSIIKKMTQDHKTPWSNILQSVFGMEMNRQKGLGKFNERLKKPGIREEEMQRFQQAYGNQLENQQQPQQGGGDQDIVSALQNLLTM